MCDEGRLDIHQLIHSVSIRGAASISLQQDKCAFRTSHMWCVCVCACDPRAFDPQCNLILDHKEMESDDTPTLAEEGGVAYLSKHLLSVRAVPCLALPSLQHHHCPIGHTLCLTKLLTEPTTIQSKHLHGNREGVITHGELSTVEDQIRRSTIVCRASSCDRYLHHQTKTTH